MEEKLQSLKNVGRVSRKSHCQDTAPIQKYQRACRDQKINAKSRGKVCVIANIGEIWNECVGQGFVEQFLVDPGRTSAKCHHVLALPEIMSPSKSADRGM
jgi:hypothetical protein